MPILTTIFIASFMTLAGALPVVFIRQMSHKRKDMLLAFTAGVMVAASTYSLIPAALHISSLSILCAGVLSGAAVLLLLEMCLPHTDFHSSSDQVTSGAFLLFITMVLHNLPEGLSVGVSFASGVADLGPLVAIAIGMQNIPEGFLLALFLVAQGASRLRAIYYATIAALMEYLAALAGLIFGEQIAGIVPYGLAFAAGAMLFIVYKELIPESHGDGHARSATITFLLGLLAMIMLTSYLE